MEQETQPVHDLEPIRRSIATLAMKLLVLLLIFEGLYEGLLYVLTLAFNIPLDWHHHFSVILLVINGLKIILEFLFILKLFIQWAGTSYLISKKHLIKRIGIINIREEISHFDDIRSITVSQSILGKLFNYGNIELITSASGGYQTTLVLAGINNPYKYETILKTLF